MAVYFYAELTDMHFVYSMYCHRSEALSVSWPVSDLNPLDHQARLFLFCRWFPHNDTEDSNFFAVTLFFVSIRSFFCLFIINIANIHVIKNFDYYYLFK